MTEIICFTGAQGTGKTTIKQALVEYLEGNGKSVIAQYHGVKDSISRDAKALGFTINQKTNFITQYYIATRFIAADLETRNQAKVKNIDYVILDRSVLDPVPYVIVADEIIYGEKKLIKQLLFNHFSLFPAILIKCMPLKGVTADKDRSSSAIFQNDVADAFNEMLSVIEKADNKVLILAPVSVNDRLEYVIDALGI